MKLKNIAVVYNKERTDMLRDRRTLFNMLLFPLIMFPLISTGFSRLESRFREKARKEAAQIMVLGAEQAPELAGKLRASGKFEIVPTEPDYKQRISDKKLRAAVEFSPGFEQALRGAGAQAPGVTLYYYETEMRSEMAVHSLEEIVGEYRKDVVQGRVAGHGLPAAALTPVVTKEQNVASAEKVSGVRLGAIIPYFIIIFCLVGALHPAMDLTAGEKERGTLETILASAVSRGELVMAKFLFVLTTSLTTAVISLASYSLTLKFAPSASARGVAKDFTAHFSLQSVLMVFVMVLPLAVLFAAALVAISLIARSYKEAQSYTGPIMMLAIVPAIASILPGIELNAKLALIPILNVSLVSKEILSGSLPWGSIALVFLSTSF
ncbi:MAG: ABC transporter permease [Acidobacteria bacterium]|nr:ABC transporter permease [Acidobacteriota bacterium]